MPRGTLVCLISLLLVFPSVAHAGETFTGYPSSTTALAYDGQYFWIGQEYKVLKWDKNAWVLAEYTPEDGLHCGTIRNIYIAPDKKTVWAASDSAIARFDGLRWYTFTAMDNVPAGPLGSAAFESDGTIWLLTGNGKGVLRYDGTRWTRFTSADGLASDTVNAVAVDGEGVVWVGTDKGVSAYNGSAWKTYTIADGLPDNAVTRILVDKNNVKWFGIGGEVGGVVRFDGATWSAYNTANGKIEAKSIDDMTLGPDNTLYVSFCDERYLDYGDPGFPPVICKTAPHVQKISNPTLYYYVFLYKINEGEISLLKKHVNNGLNYDTSFFLSPIVVDNRGKLYVMPEIPSRKPVFSGYVRRSPLCDDDNVIWFIESDWKHGWLASYDGRNRNGFGFGPPPTDITALATTPKDEVWAGDNRAGIAVFSGNAWKATPGEYSPFGGITCLCSNNEGMTWGGVDSPKLLEFQGDDSRPINARISPGAIASMVFDETGTLWAGFGLYGKGIASYDGSNWTQYTSANGLIDDTVNTVTVDPANIKWFGTPVGISRFDNTTWMSFATTADGDSLGSVKALAAGENGSLWAGSDKGLLKYDGSSWHRFTMADGLADSRVCSLALTSQGIVLAGTPNGLSRYDGKAWKTYTTADGLPSDRVQALAVDHNNVVWIGTDQGLVSYREAETPNFVLERETLPEALAAPSNRPNPFNPSTTISFTLPASGRASLTVYDITGRKVRELLNGPFPAGSHAVAWDGKDDAGQTVSSGVYLSRLSAGNRNATGKMLLVK